MSYRSPQSSSNAPAAQSVLPTEQPAQWRSPLQRALTDYAPPTLLVLLLLAGWEFLVRFLAVPDWLLPPPSQIMITLTESLPILRGHVAVTLTEALIGLGLGFGVGFGLALAIDLSPFIRRAIYPLLIASQTIPIVAIAPLLVIGLGFGLLPKIVVVALVTFFPIVISMVDGLRAAERDTVQLLRAMNASRWQILRLVQLPAALPALFSGLKIAVTYSVIGAVIAEWLGANSGLGVYISRSLRAFRTDQVFVGALVTSAITIVLFLFVLLLERRLTYWKRGNS